MANPPQAQAECHKLREQLRINNCQLQDMTDEISFKDMTIRNQRNEIDLLKNQILIYVDDFNQERLDRTTAMAKLHDVEAKLEIATRQLQRLDIQQMRDLGQRRAAAMELHKLEYEHTHPNDEGDKGPSSENTDNRYDEIDC